MLDALEVFAHLAGIETPGLGQQNAPPDAVEQGDAEIIFQRGNLPADGALGQRQFFSGAGEALVPRGGFKSNQQFDAGDFPFHCSVLEVT